MVKLAEKRDELEKLIEKQKGKSQPTAQAGLPERESKMVAPATMPQQPQQQMPSQPQQQMPPQMPQQAAPEGFSGMQQSMMEGGAPAMPQQPQQQIPPQMPQPMPQMPPQMQQQPEMEQELPEAEPEEIATIREPSLPVAQLAYNRTNIEEIEALIESVVEEKWRQAMESFQGINLWKEKARTEIISIKQEILRLEQRFENMEKSMIGRVSEYDKNILDVGAEIKAMEKVLQKILQPLAKNVKELENITKRLKK